MLMKDPKKTSIALLIAKKAGKPDNIQDQPEKDGAQSDDSIAYDSAAEELMKSLEAKDAKGVVEALKSLVQMCMDEEESESPEEESSEENKSEQY